MPRRRRPTSSPEPTSQGRAPHYTVAQRPADDSGPCEACGAVEPPTHRDLFRVARPGSRAGRLGRRYERLCVTCARKPDTWRQWEAGAFLQPTAHETLSAEERRAFWLRLTNPL